TQKKPVQLLHDWEIKAEIVDRKVYERAPKKIKEHPDHAWLNPADLEWPLTVRSAMEGERWSPLGMVLQRQKLSDFFINQKIPRRARESWPIVSVAGSILWVAGLRIAQAWRLTGQEVEVLHLQLIPPHD
ncbi:MAG TPA: tRNA lysidine(34) synthetase TilS, partial [Chloroflexi bacterium]|nr:tRNA lysidine(34) synthetase TilS [Chloroflexota bacterium]